MIILLGVMLIEEDKKEVIVRKKSLKLMYHEL